MSNNLRKINPEEKNKVEECKENEGKLAWKNVEEKKEEIKKGKKFEEKKGIGEREVQSLVVWNSEALMAFFLYKWHDLIGVLFKW